MASLFGNISLCLSLFFAIFQFFFSKKNKELKLISISVLGLLFSSLFSFFLLIYLYLVSDFSVLNVYQNSHTTKPLLYKISGGWGNHEGSMLLWILVLTIFNYFIYKLYNKKNSIFIYKTLETQSIIIIGFILFIQIILGILTLLSGAQIILSSMHQISSIFLVSSCVYFLYLNSNFNLQPSK